MPIGGASAEEGMPCSLRSRLVLSKPFSRTFVLCYTDNNRVRKIKIKMYCYKRVYNLKGSTFKFFGDKNPGGLD